MYLSECVFEFVCVCLNMCLQFCISNSACVCLFIVVVHSQFVTQCNELSLETAFHFPFQCVCFSCFFGG